MKTEHKNWILLPVIYLTFLFFLRTNEAAATAKNSLMNSSLRFCPSLLPNDYDESNRQRAAAWRLAKKKKSNKKRINRTKRFSRIQARKIIKVTNSTKLRKSKRTVGWKGLLICRTLPIVCWPVHFVCCVSDATTVVTQSLLSLRRPTRLVANYLNIYSRLAANLTVKFSSNH